MMIKGVITALITPFAPDGSIDYPALGKIVEHQIDGGVSGILATGSTGESATLTTTEHIEVIRAVIEFVGGRVPVIAGTGSNSTQEALELTEAAAKLGAHSSLQVAPYYNKPNQEGMYTHFKTIADEIDLPMIVYNIPGRTARNVDNKTLLALSDHPKIVGVKESNGDLGQMVDLITHCPQDFAVYCGDDGYAAMTMLFGAAGTVSVSSNLIPTEMVEMANLCLEGAREGAFQAHKRISPLVEALTKTDINPTPIKAAMEIGGFCSGTLRLPMTQVSESNYQLIHKTMKDYGLV